MQPLQAHVSVQEFNFPIEPTAKGRPRFANGHAFTPAKTRFAEEGIREGFIAEGAELYARPVALKVDLVFGVPRRTRSQPLPVVRPDLDQYVKLVLDAGNMVVWADDSQIVSISAMKVYTDSPFTKIRVEEA